MVGMLQEDLKRRIKDANDILQVVRSYGLELKRAGRSWKACCPFHQEKTPSFNVNPEIQCFKCFGCGKSGDVFSFVMEHERVEFPDALRMLAERVGITIEFDPALAAQHKKDTDWKKYLYDLNTAAAAIYREMLYSDLGAAARAYLTKRGILEQSWQTFGLGFAPEGGSVLTARLAARKAPPKAIERAGLASLREDGSVYDYFRGRVMFPIADSQGRVIGFGGRVLDDGEPKYLNTRETPLFRKGATIYGLPQARDTIVDQRKAVLVEGYTDVIMCHQFGVTNVVACLGTAVTPDHVKALGRLADEIVLLTDSDTAGAKASERSLEILFQEEMPAQIVRLPGAAKDPCDFLLEHGREAFEASLGLGVPLFEYKFQRVAQSHDLASTTGQADAAQELLALIGLVQDPLRRAGFRRDVSARLNLPESALTLPNLRNSPGPRAQVNSVPVHDAGAPEHSLAHAERELLRWIFHQPAWLESAANAVDFASFTGVPERLIARAILESLGDGQLPPAAEAVAAEACTPAGAVARAVLERISAGASGAEIGTEDQGAARARALCIVLAEVRPEHMRLKSNEAYEMRVHAVSLRRVEHDLAAAQREESAARASGDAGHHEQAQQKVSALVKAMMVYKRGPTAAGKT